MNPKGRAPVPWTIERFEALVERVPESGCWLWTSYADPRGYGKACVNGRVVGAHRLALQLFAAVPAEGLHVLHRCDVPSCVNPAHLFVGTHTDNMRDASRKGRLWANKQRKGDQHG